MKSILVIVPTSEEHRRWLREAVADKSDTYELVFADSEAEIPAELIRNASAILGSLPASRIGEAEKLEWLQLNSAGADPYSRPGFLPDETLLTCAVGAYNVSVSEHMLALTMDLVRGFRYYAVNQGKHIWEQGPDLFAVDGSVIAVLGMGNIGSAYAQKVKALGAYVIGVTRSAHEKPDYADEMVTVDALESVLPRADIVAMIMPGSDETCHMMNEQRLRIMKPGSYILNAGRGNAIDLEALKKVLDEGHIAGAALDVTEPEPLPEDDPLWDYTNVIITPHVAGGFQLNLRQSKDGVLKIFADNLKNWVNGKELMNIVR